MQPITSFDQFISYLLKIRYCSFWPSSYDFVAVNDFIITIAAGAATGASLQVLLLTRPCSAYYTFGMVGAVRSHFLTNWSGQTCWYNCVVFYQTRQLQRGKEDQSDVRVEFFMPPTFSFDVLHSHVCKLN
ncbi:hypothetical protein LIPSTDRAFT_227498 [Lipomyces starkeyi NRRL Y-11557]|uniref:Uncharacterized protein n=1 Tax=Lipomyces starkeyi NRRL Y-11557 TaxID=675824 RepID=A0A1E3QCG2_LIPST|nr:hypothetical protein LIPSTDRAFT_227498 [Lipomyces starkeyi NRRL Y-11557]